MKPNTWIKMTAVGAAVALATTLIPQTSFAGSRDRHHDDHHNNTAAAIFAGVATVGIIAAVASQHSNVSIDYRVGTNVYRPPHCPPPPPPPRCEPPQRWIPGHYETVREKVVHPGYWDTVTEPAEYGWVRHGCRWEYTMIKPPCTKRVWVPERCEWVEKQVWVAGHFEPVPQPYAGRR